MPSAPTRRSGLRSNPDRMSWPTRTQAGPSIVEPRSRPAPTGIFDSPRTETASVSRRERAATSRCFRFATSVRIRVQAARELVGHAVLPTSRRGRSTVGLGFDARARVLSSEMGLTSHDRVHDDAQATRSGVRALTGLVKSRHRSPVLVESAALFARTRLGWSGPIGCVVATCVVEAVLATTPLLRLAFVHLCRRRLVVGFQSLATSATLAACRHAYVRSWS